LWKERLKQIFDNKARPMEGEGLLEVIKIGLQLLKPPWEEL
jgi:hypothetical protein